MTAGPSAAVTDPPERPAEAGGAARAAAAFERRIGPGRELADRAGEIANAAHAMAVRFHQGGKLVVFGIGGAAADAQHVAVEFVHPVIVGKRALPAVSLTSDAATVTGVAARRGPGRRLLASDQVPGRAGRHRAGNRARGELPQRGRPGCARRASSGC